MSCIWWLTWVSCAYKKLKSRCLCVFFCQQPHPPEIKHVLYRLPHLITRYWNVSSRNFQFCFTALSHCFGNKTADLNTFAFKYPGFYIFGQVIVKSGNSHKRPREGDFNVDMFMVIMVRKLWSNGLCWYLQSNE